MGRLLGRKEFVSLDLRTPWPEKRNLNNPAVPLSSPEAWRWITGGTISEAGETVNEATVLAISTAYACIRVLSESVASLPCKVYSITDKGRTLATDHRLSHLLGTAPNNESTAFVFFETFVKSMALCGNGYAEIERIGTEPVALWPLNPRDVQPIRLQDGSLAYKVTDGMPEGHFRTVAAGDMLHCPLFPAFDGVLGLSPLQLSMQTFGQARAAEKFGSRFFRNSATPSVALQIAEEVDPQTKAAMRAEWESLQGGTNTHRVAILDQGMDLKTFGFNAEEAQYLETRRFLREEIAAIYRVPAHMVGDNTKLSNANTENLNLSFVVDSLRPYLSRLEGELARKLLPSVAGTRSTMAVQFDVSERQRGDFASSMAGFASGRQWGYLTANDCRRSLGLNEAGPEADVLLNPVNMQNASALLESTSVESTPTA